MPKVVNTQDRYDITAGVREDLTDFITNVDPEDTPVMSSIRKAKAGQTYHEYQRDILGTPNADNAAIDGDEAVTATRTAPTRVGNHCQIFTKTVGVTGRAEAVDKAGRRSQMAYNKALAMTETKRDIEAMILSNNIAAPGSTGVASKSGGLGVHIFTNAQHNGAGATAAHTAGAPTVAVTGGTARTYTDTLLKAGALACYNESGKAPPMVVMSAAHKTLSSAFVGISANRTETGKKAATIVGAADYYLSDFGLMAFVPHYIMSGRGDVFGIDPGSLRMAYLRGWQSNKIGRKGDAEEEQILCDVTLEVRSQKNMFKISNLTP